MSWTNFQQYLEKTILQKKEEIEEENEEEEENKDNKEESPYTLRPATKTKYSVSKEKELITTLTNLIESIDNHQEYSSFSSEESEYHSLPSLENLVNEQGQLKTWNQLFPKREETHFGQKQEIEVEISRELWTILGKIFNDYAQTATRKERLEEFANEDQMMSKILLEGLARLNATSLKKQGFDIKLKEWLKEYEELEGGEQIALAKSKKQIEVILKTLEEVKEEKEESKSWYQNIPWSKVLWYGGGTLLVILVLGWFWRKFKE